MAGDKPSISAASSRSTTPTPTASSLTVPVDAPRTASTADRRETRASPPSTLPSELILKAKSQVGRLEYLKMLQTQLPTHTHTTSLDEVRLLSAHIEEVHQAFCEEHAYFVSTWPVKCLDHEYFVSDMAVQERQLALTLKLKLNRLREDVEAIAQSRIVASSSTPSRASKLPEIALPTFSGSCVDWPAFSELFTSLIIHDTQLMKIGRLHYLRSSLRGEPSRQVNSYPLTGSSFQPCWEYLTKRFSNKRLLIQEQLDRLFSLSPSTTCSAASLDSLMSSLTEVDKSLKALGAAEDMHNCVLVHMATNCLDKNTREAWETSVGTATDYPRYERLEAFVENKIVVLERLEASAQSCAHKKAQPPSAAPSPPAQRQSSSNTATQSQQGASAQRSPYSYQCDCCQKDHFIVMCPQFRGLTVEARRKLITTSVLCRNCCGRHKTEACKSAHKCKTCGARHHTMLQLTPPKPPA